MNVSMNGVGYSSDNSSTVQRWLRAVGITVTATVSMELVYLVTILYIPYMCVSIHIIRNHPIQSFNQKRMNNTYAIRLTGVAAIYVHCTVHHTVLITV